MEYEKSQTEKMQTVFNKVEISLSPHLITLVK